MSRAFVKEDSADQPEDPPERRSSGLPNYVTPNGKKELSLKAAELDAACRTLRADKNDDPLHKQRLRTAERDLLYYERRLKTAILVDNSGCGAEEARFGARITVKDGAGTLRDYYIVGEDEADAGEGKISWASPLASTLLGARPGVSLIWRKESGEDRLEVISVSYTGPARNGA